MTLNDSGKPAATNLAFWYFSWKYPRSSPTYVTSKINSPGISVVCPVTSVVGTPIESSLVQLFYHYNRLLALFGVGGFDGFFLVFPPGFVVFVPVDGSLQTFA